MRKSVLALSIPLSILITVNHLASATTQTIVGVVSDSMCVKRHMMPGKSDAECIRECVKSGSGYVLVVGNKSYALSGKPALIAPFAGKHVTVQGIVTQNSITAQSIH